MRKVALLAAICVALLGVSASAQQNAAVNLLDSPVKTDNEVYNAGEQILCSMAIPGGASLFGADTVTGGRYAFNELFGGFRTWETNLSCALVITWSTAFAGTTQTGLALKNGDSANYWAVNPASQTLDEYTYGTGAATGGTLTLPVGGLWGSAVVDDNQGPADIVCVNDIVADAYTCIDMTTGSITCSFANADNTATGAFGNGNGDAVTPGDCSGQTLVQATGLLGEGQVSRVGQYDCSGNDAACTDRWDVSTFSTFTNGIDEINVSGQRGLFMCDNAGANIFILIQPTGIDDCQDIDPDMDLMYVNGSQGGFDFNVDVSVAATLSVGMQKTAAGNGKFVAHMHAGAPNSGTVSTLFDLGDSCFDMTGGTQAVNHNNVGKTNIVGASNYFGTPIASVAKAPGFLEALSQANVDAANLSVGSSWTHQSIHLNGAASSKKGGSLSNGVIMTMQN